MRAFVMTRGRSRDYGFLGDEPAAEWWSACRAFSSFERPTLFVEGLGCPTKGEAAWRAYLSAIPSARRDRVNTRIRYTLVFESEPQGEAAAPWLVDTITAWLEEIAGAVATEKNRLSARLDAAFPETLVESADADGDVQGRLTEALAALGSTRGPAGEAEPEDPAYLFWLGKSESPAARAALAARVRALLDGSIEGRALVVNLAAVGDAAVLSGDSPSCAALMSGLDDDDAPSVPRPFRKKKASTTDPQAATDEPTPGRVTKAKGVMIGLAVVIVNLAALAAYLSRSW
jgi:hypothetical protein